MKVLGLDVGAVGAGRSIVPSAERGAPALLSGISLLAIVAAGLVSPADAASFLASNQSELYGAIADAQASSDASSTITLTSSFELTSVPPAIAGKDITIDTGVNTLSYNSAATFDIATGASLTITGQIQGTGVLNSGVLNKLGGGELIIDGASATGVTRIGLRSGSTLINGGSEFTFGSSSGGTVAALGLAGDSGGVASLTISGEGTKVVSNGPNPAQQDPTDISAGAGSQSLLTIEQGASYSTGGGIRVHTPSSQGTATITVRDQDSLLAAGGFVSVNGTSYINVLNGGVIDISGSTSLGGVLNTGFAAANATAVVSGEGSRWDTTTVLTMLSGSLSVMDGGVVTAATVNVGTTTNAVATNFDVLVSGAGSELSAGAISVGTRRGGSLTIADDGVVSVNGGASALVLGGAFPNSDAALNIGGAAGAAAAAAGKLEASAITLAATADINFNHTEAGYVFDIPVNGTGAINQIAGHTIFNASQLGFTGLTTVGGGMLEVNGMLGGTVDVLGGTLAGTGTVGATRLVAGGAIAPGGGAIGTLTIDGDYTGAGGLLQIQAVLEGDGSPTDLLVVTGGTTGATNVAVTNMGGSGAATVNGIKIIDVLGTSDGVFNLLGDTVVDGQQAVIAGAYLYGMHQGTLTDADGDWYLRSILDPDDGTPIFQPAAPVVETYVGAALQTFNTAETLQQRVGNRSFAGDVVDGNAAWGRIQADHASVMPGISDTGAGYDVSTWRLQAGLDGVVMQSDVGRLIGGINLQVGTISADVDAPSGAGGIDSSAYGLGATLTWYGSAGLYLDAQGQLTWFDSTLSSDTLDRTIVSGNQGFGYLISLEAGQQIGLGDNWSVTPQAQLSYSESGFDDFVDPYGSTVSLEKGNSLRGRLGVSADYEDEWEDTAGETGRTHLYAIANLSYEFLDGAATSIGGETLSSKADPLWAGIGAGGSINWAGDALSLHGEASVNTSLGGTDSYGVGFTAGINGRF